MTVYVDNWRQMARVGRLNAVWSHLTADTDEELHEFAARLGMKRAWAQKMDDPNQYRHHYDLTEPRRQRAIELGATTWTWREAGKVTLAESRRLKDLK